MSSHSGTISPAESSFESVRDFNHWAYGPSCEGYSCPLCNQEFEPDNEDLADVLSEAIGQWIEQSGPALVPCPSCKGHVPVTEWRCQPPLGFGNLSVVFWNWPPLDSAHGESTSSL